MIDIWSLLLNAAIAAGIAALAGALGVQLYNTSRKNELDYWSTRVDLAHRWLEANARSSPNVRSRTEEAHVVAELQEINDYLRASSLSSRETAVLDFERKRFVRRIATLPRPRSVGGWFLTFIYYFYGVGTLFNTVIVVPMMMLADDAPIRWPQALSVCAAGAVMAFFARRSAINSAILQTLLDREKRRRIAHTPTVLAA